MSEANSGPPQEAAFEETLYTRAVQLLTDPITDSTRRRQNLLLLLSVLSLAVFFGVATPDKVSFFGVYINIATPLTPAGVPSTTAASVAHTALRFNRVLSPVLLYCLLSFWLSLYRDRKAQDYLRGLAQFKIKEAADRDYAISERRRKRQLANIERFQELTAKRREESAKIQQEIEKIGEEFRKICGPIREEHAKAFAEFERLRREDAARDPKLAERMSGLGAQIEHLSEKQDEDLKLLQDRFDALMEDPEIRKLDLKMDAIIVDSPSDWKMSSERGVLLTDIGDDVRLWRRLWYWLEVIFPSGLGLLAFVAPLGSIW
ncbi:hypothetical protein [Tunturiibacter lichenicola]|uniref:hypothetical protein n=1 Tax=Tunturiibacter lichenicola TaxID=2051959 RepID=UPI0021B19520|nr:hypothetical protein [Edaphobacter lichenicola]